MRFVGTSLSVKPVKSWAGTAGRAAPAGPPAGMLSADRVHPRQDGITLRGVRATLIEGRHRLRARRPPHRRPIYYPARSAKISCLRDGGFCYSRTIDKAIRETKWVTRLESPHDPVNAVNTCRAAASGRRLDLPALLAANRSHPQRPHRRRHHPSSRSTRFARTRLPRHGRHHHLHLSPREGVLTNAARRSPSSRRHLRRAMKVDFPHRRPT